MNEERIAERLMSPAGNSILATDGYKFSMAQAGFPLRQETFYLSCRKGDPLHVPFDLTAIVRALLPRPPSIKEAAFLATHGYGLTPAMEKALHGKLDIWAAPEGSWVLPGEPILTVTGPSFLVSWLEPLAIMLHYPLQVATAYLKGERQFDVTCQGEADLVELTLEALCLPSGRIPKVTLNIRTTDYCDNVHEAATHIVTTLQGDAQRAFEVGLRAATCMEQHLLALGECKHAGWTKTSNVYGAFILYMVPVGTTGHEHQQRHGNDYVGFRAIRDCRPEPPSYLFDTVDPIHSGIPDAIRVMDEDRSRPCSVRLDSGDQEAQTRLLWASCQEKGLSPNFIFEDGYTAERTRTNEQLCESLGIPRARRMYGYGGEVVCIPAFTLLHRNRVSAAYKLSQSGGIPVMKWSGSPGKRSLPGHPVVYVPTGNNPDRLPRLIGQYEDCPEGYALLVQGSEPDGVSTRLGRSTLRLVFECASRVGKTEKE